MVASTSPGRAKMIWMSCRCEPGAEPALAPNSSTKTRPETTGETENGSSIRVISSGLAAEVELGDRPGGGDRRRCVLSGTEIAATSRVSLIDARASGSVIAAEPGAEPLRERLGRAPRPAAAAASARHRATAAAISSACGQPAVRRRPRRGHAILRSLPALQQVEQRAASRTRCSSMTQAIAAAPA